MRVMMIAGEASGDLHGAGVVRELKQRDPSIEIYGIGGTRMKERGMELIHHNSEMSFMGFVEVVKNLSLIRRIDREMTGLLERRRPDVVVLIDYPGFNLRFARTVKRRNIKVLYYISPQVWAWHKSRVKKMKSLVDRMKVVFPFEVDLYSKEGIDVEFVGHPLAESLKAQLSRDEFFGRHRLDPQAKLLALLPGSRRQEIQNILPVMVAAASRLRDGRRLNIALGMAHGLPRSLVESYVPLASGITIVEDGTYDLMNHADAAMVTSGTATLETGWFATPMVVVYRTSWLTYVIGRLLVDIQNIGLVNIVAGRRVVPEFIQSGMTVANLLGAVRRMLDDEAYAASIRSGLSVIRERLGGPGASARVAESIIELGQAA
jgi:lipid-A-disaccharide synthase